MCSCCLIIQCSGYSHYTCSHIDHEQSACIINQTISYRIRSIRICCLCCNTYCCTNWCILCYRVCCCIAVCDYSNFVYKHNHIYRSCRSCTRTCTIRCCVSNRIAAYCRRINIISCSHRNICTGRILSSCAGICKCIALCNGHRIVTKKCYDRWG